MTEGIKGAVRLELADLRDGRNRRWVGNFPVEIHIGGGWPDMVDLSKLRTLAWSLGWNLTITGADPAAVKYTVEHLQQYAEAEPAWTA
ncbi:MULTISPECIES: hypothetical protein [Amycolatopsis]|uniref:hypothetical protein n=1 Tax=Amycolatopsis TaxID=1813 RepID=UPI000B8AE89D|nr:MULTISPECIES: hypothetical protein [Amycolatopsis]OXM73075.1 hypothetical protein CF166_11165 [Amycolatopsis sp. KNN50.9b]